MSANVIKSSTLTTALFAVLLSLTGCSLGHFSLPFFGDQSSAMKLKPVNFTQLDADPLSNEIGQSLDRRFRLERSTPVAEREDNLIYPALFIANEPEVARFENFYLRSAPNFLNQSLARKERYSPMLEKVFREHGLPIELLSIALVESGFQSRARSDAGAVGLWQFTKQTGRNYGLQVSFGRDDRLDPIKSTVAAAKHLSDLYEEFDDWYLAIGAYNSGAGGMRRAMEASNSRDFYEIARSGKLRRETIEYVSRVLAVARILSQPNLSAAAARTNSRG